MARFSYEDADKYGNSGNGGSYFKLSNDGDVARVQLLGDDMNDFPGYAVHKVTVGDSDRWVNCLREYNDPVDVCPFCAAKKKQQARLFIPLYNIDEGEVQVWERGKTFISKLAGYCARNPEVASMVTEIERHGKSGDTSTTYELYPSREEPEYASLDDFLADNEIPEVLGRYVLDKSAEDMEYYLSKGRFPAEDSSDDDVKPRRGGRDDKKESSEKEERRRPSRRSRRDEEEF
jgi:hypothetical protein